MKTETIDKMKSLKRTALYLATVVENFNKITSKPSVDKYELCFGGDDRFTIFCVKNVRFTGYTGYYGSSGCSTFGSVPEADVPELFLAALNRNRDKILQDMAALAREKAATLRAEAEKEIRELQELVNAVDEPATEEVAS